MILSNEYARAELLELRTENQISIRISGNNKSDFRVEIERALEDLHTTLVVKADGWILCNCDKCLNAKDTYEPYYRVR